MRKILLAVSCAALLLFGSVASYAQMTLESSSFLGGSLFEQALDVAVDEVGCIYVIGHFESTDFPTPTGDPITVAVQDIFVAKFDPTFEEMLYLKTLGSPGIDAGTAIVVDDLGQATITGWVEGAPSFPITNPIPGLPPAANRDLIVVTLSADGSTVLYSTVMTGDKNDEGHDLVVDPVTGRITVVGCSDSTDLSQINPLLPAGVGQEKSALVLMLDSDGSVALLSQHGGNMDDLANGVVLDGTGKTLVAGYTVSTSTFPVTAGAPACGSSQDAFLLTIEDLTLTSSQCFGSAGREITRDLAINSQNQLVVVGDTCNTFFVTECAYDDPQPAAGDDIFVMIFDSIATGLPQTLCSTFLRGSSGLIDDQSFGLALDSLDRIHIGGSSDTTNLFPNQQLVGGGGEYEGFVATLSPDLSTVIGSVNWGGEKNEVVRAVAYNPITDEIVVCGETFSHDLPMINPLQLEFGGSVFDGG